MTLGKPFSPFRAFTGVFIPDGLVSFHGISAAEKICLARLYRYCGKKDHCWPRQDELAEELNVEVRTIHTYLSHLEQAGFLTVEQRGMGQSNMYRMIAHSVFFEDDETGNNFPVQSGSTSSGLEVNVHSGPSIELK